MIMTKAFYFSTAAQEKSVKEDSKTVRKSFSAAAADYGIKDLSGYSKCEQKFSVS